MMAELLGTGEHAFDGTDTNTSELPGRDLFTVAKCMVPTDAWLLCGVLVAGGVPAVVADANHVQADLLIAPALGGVRILAPQAYLAQAAEIIAAFERGDYALDDDTDVGVQIV